MVTSGEAGRRGKDVRSDCWVKYDPDTAADLSVALTSKVEPMYGKVIRDQCRRQAASFCVTRGTLTVEDAGALPFVIEARLEAALTRAGFSAPIIPTLNTKSERVQSPKDRLRRSRLYLPGNEPKFFINAGLHKPDAIILDLEDSVAPAEKDAARVLVRNALRYVDFYGAEVMVRINQGESGRSDLNLLDLNFVDLILIPKVEDAELVREVDDQIRHARSESTRNIWLMPIIESAKGGINAYSIALASPRVVALAIGLEDYTADIGVPRTLEGQESFWLRSQVVNAARAAGVQPIDTVFSDVGDEEGLRQSVLEAKALGFDGKGCIHPRQIPIVHKAFAPDSIEIAKAKKIVAAFEEATRLGLGVVSLGTKMIDPPVVKRALRVMELAKAAGVIDG